MMFGLTLTTAPTTEPVTLEEVKTHLRVTFTEDDAYIYGLIKSARRWCENYQNLSYITQTWTFWRDDWPGDEELVLPRPPLQSVTHVKYYDVDDSPTTFASSNYLVDTVRNRIVLNDDQDWPSETLRPGQGIEVQYVAGYGAASAVPDEIKHAIKLMCSHFYEQREPILVGSTAVQVPFLVTHLLWQDRLINL